MKRLLPLTLFAAMLMLSGTGVSGQQTRQGIALFNGKDLSNWTFYLRDPAVDPSTVFTVQDGVIHITGDPFGYMRTKDEYSDYRLTLEYRYPVEATNSGIFLFVQPGDTIWPQCFECQLAAGRAGDFVCMSGATMAESTQRVISKFNDSNEKPVGEWNRIEITCRGNSIEVMVNGLLQNRGTGTSVSRGNICLQSEGKDIEFRNVLLTPLAP